MKQQLLEFGHRQSYADSDFIVSQCNKLAYDFISEFPKTWSGNIGLITGRAGAGKTHLANIWARKADAVTITKQKNIFRQEEEILPNINKYLSYAPGKQKNIVVENIDDFSKESHEALFHLINKITAEKNYLLLTSSKKINDMDFWFDDLKSRLQAVFQAEILEPDSDVMRALIIKLFSDQQLAISLDVVDFLLKRIERDYKKMLGVVIELANKSQEKKRNITVPFVKEVLEV